MNPVTHVLLFGSLARFNRGKRDEALELDLRVPTGISDVLDLLKIPAKEVSLALVNHRSVPKDSVILPGDDCRFSQENTPYSLIGWITASEYDKSERLRRSPFGPQPASCPNSESSFDTVGQINFGLAQD